MALARPDPTPPLPIASRWMAALCRQLPDAVRVEPGGVQELAGLPGAYALLLHIGNPVAFSRRVIPCASLSGWFVYAGSAHGGGGIRARLRRHFRLGKPIRWHIDELTNAADYMAAIAIPGGSECRIVDSLLQSAQFETALAGFGSSDCRHCAAHLLRPVP
ncbi:MAG: DUF123 domain-containing protein [Novosphingobium sp.]